MEKKIPFLSCYLVVSDDRPRGTVEYAIKSVNGGLLATSSQYKEYVADDVLGYKQFIFNAFGTIMYDKYRYDFATAANFFKAAGDIEDEVMAAVNEILNSPLAESKKKNSKKKAMKESLVKWTAEIGEETSAYELNEQVKKTLRTFGYTCGGNESDRHECTPKTYYIRDLAFDGQTVYLCSVKGEFYDEVIIQVCDSKVVGMANYTIRNPEGVLWMGQSPKEFVEDISDMTSSYNEF